MEPFIFSVISLAWQGTGWGADALAEAGRTDPQALTLGLQGSFKLGLVASLGKTNENTVFLLFTRKQSLQRT